MPSWANGTSPATPSVFSWRGSKRTGMGISVRAAKRSAIRATLTLAFGTGAMANIDWAPLKIARHGSVANSE